jgi:lipoyl(octanoyl) transferase
MMDLKKRGTDLHQYVCDLEGWIIEALKDFGVQGERRQGRVGIWITDGSEEKKIAAVGVRVRKWVTYHGVSINLDPDLSHYDGIVPCGIKECGVTSLSDMGIKASMDDLDRALRKGWAHVFG